MFTILILFDPTICSDDTPVELTPGDWQSGNKPF